MRMVRAITAARAKCEVREQRTAEDSAQVSCGGTTAHTVVRVEEGVTARRCVQKAVRRYGEVASATPTYAAGHVKSLRAEDINGCRTLQRRHGNVVLPRFCVANESSVCYVVIGVVAAWCREWHGKNCYREMLIGLW